MSQKKYIMAIDQGTTGTTVSILNKKGILKVKINEEFRQIFPQPAWVEHDVRDIWKSTVSTIKKALSQSGVNGTEIIAIGITNQRETVALWNKKNGVPVHNAIVWQCRRTASYCEKIRKQKGVESLIRKKTGLVLDPYFSASKINWILNSKSEIRKKAKAGKLLAGTMDSFLLWKLTSGVSHKTDVSNASRTMLMNVKIGQWDEDLLKLFKVPKCILPEICPSSGEFGVTKGLKDILPDGIPISGIAGDQQAALFGQGAFSVGEAKCTFGTGSFLLMNTGDELVYSKSKLLTTVAWQLKDDKKLTYAVEGGAFVCGAAVQWLRDGLDFFKDSSEIEALAKKVKDSLGVEFVPALTGLGAPYWDAEARGCISGLTRGVTKAHVARATLEGMALQNTDILNSMQSDLGRRLKSLKVDGGAAKNNLLMQIQADYLGVNIERPKAIETTSIGAAYLAGLGVGFWSNLDEIKKIGKIERVFESKLTNVARKKRLENWHKAVKRAML